MDQRLEIAAKLGNWEKVNLNNLTQEMVSAPAYNGINLLHIAALSGSLGKFPKHLLNPNGLLLENMLKETVIHIAAGKGEISVIPKKLLTEKNMTKKNMEGNTPVHYVALRGSFPLLPKPLHTDKILNTPNKHDLTPLDFAILGLINYGDAQIINDKKMKNFKDNIRIILKNLKLTSLIKLNTRTNANFYNNQVKHYTSEEITTRLLLKTLKKQLGKTIEI